MITTSPTDKLLGLVLCFSSTSDPQTITGPYLGKVIGADYQVRSCTWFSSFLLVTYRSVVLPIANSSSISALTIAGSVFRTGAIEAQALIGMYFLRFFDALDIITGHCLMLFATTIKTRPRARPRLVSSFMVFGKKCSGLISTEI
ncbi:uncharacterized protein LOC113664161 isoform X3 [Pocillopora damicornis]|uniref:uncharacterized protein LOC113664161 isoform X3 n=1 Tax=Pocillopora damicornis TaxID=46731 RepID=UPI000F552505|nr:uncharacterized protein LOC113664161 isoform X3 [Pocillopora damicornis]